MGNLRLLECECCSKPTSNRVLDYVEDAYGMACSEAGVPTHVEIEVPVCLECVEKNSACCDGSGCYECCFPDIGAFA